MDAPVIPETFIAEKPFEFLSQFAVQLDAAASLDMMATLIMPPIGAHLVARVTREWLQEQQRRQEAEALEAESQEAARLAVLETPPRAPILVDFLDRFAFWAGLTCFIAAGLCVAIIVMSRRP